MPPSVPPERPLTRRIPSSVGTISSCASEPGRGGELEAVADLDALDRLDAHQRAGQPRVEAAVPVHVRAEARRQAVHDDLDDAAEGVAVLVGLVDARRPSARWRRVEAAHRVVVERGHVVAVGTRAGRGGYAAELDDVRDHRSRRRPAARKLEATRPSATRAAVSRAEARSRTGRASSKSYFCMPTRSACPGRGRVSGALRASASSSTGSTGSADITWSHLGHSVLPISTATGPPCVSPCRTPPTNRDLVLLELHPGAASVAEPAPRQGVAQVVGRDRDVGGQPLEDGDEERAVGLARSEPAQHGVSLSRDPQRPGSPHIVVRPATQSPTSRPARAPTNMNGPNGKPLRSTIRSFDSSAPPTPPSRNAA